MLRLLESLRSDAPPRADSLQGVESQSRPDPLRSLAQAAGTGDVAAQRTLAMSVGPALLHVLRSALGVGYPELEDVLQEVLASLFSALPRFRNECTVLHFGCRIALHTALNARRRHDARGRSLAGALCDEIEEAAATDELSPAEQLAASRRREALRSLLQELPLAQAEVLGMHTMLGHTVEETAAALHVPVNTVRSRLRLALGALRRRIQADEGLLEIVGGMP
jgi:RNA polymerase sigma-70 factor (ECF subfamily)